MKKQEFTLKNEKEWDFEQMENWVECRQQGVLQNQNLKMKNGSISCLKHDPSGILNEAC